MSKLNWIVIAAAVLGLFLAADLSRRSGPPPIGSALAQDPPTDPFHASLVGVGTVEPEVGAIVSPATAGVVSEILVRSGQVVKKGDPLYRLDTRDLQAQLAQARTSVALAEADLVVMQTPLSSGVDRIAHAMLSFLAKPAAAQQAIQTAELAVQDAETSLARAKLQVAEAQSKIDQQALDVQEKDQEYKRLESIYRGGAGTSQLEMEQAKTNWQMAQAALEVAKDELAIAEIDVQSAQNRKDQAQSQLVQTQAESAQSEKSLQMMLETSTEPELAKAKAAIDQAKAQVARLETQIETMTVRAPFDGTLLRCEVRLGQSVNVGETNPDSATILLGDVDPLHVRVMLDEYDIAAFDKGAKAVAFARGRGKQPIELDYVLTEPYVVPKIALTHSQTEIVDVRVMVVIYAVKKADTPLMAGQQLDVYIERK